nr:hypothetical protein [Achromobacter ruhlandii]
MNDAMKECIEACLGCYRTCLEEAMGHCLEAGGQHVEPGHFRRMMACAEMCRTSAHMMLLGAETMRRYVMSAPSHAVPARPVVTPSRACVHARTLAARVHRPVNA